MQFKRQQHEFDIKSLKKDGSFSGYGSVFNNMDAYNDVVMPGAFTNSLQDWNEKKKLPPVLWQHDSTQPIGPFTSMSEDATGLYVEGSLLIKSVQKAAEAYSLMESGAINGMSIGFNVPDDGYEYDAKNGVMKLTQVQLWEVSIVTFPANSLATVTELKQIFASGLPTLRQFEGFLRDAGCSRKQAADIAISGLVPLLQRDADGNKSRSDETSLIDSVATAIRDFKL